MGFGGRRTVADLTKSKGQPIIIAKEIPDHETVNELSPLRHPGHTGLIHHPLGV